MKETCMIAGHERVDCACRKCGTQMHDWQEHQYYCPYIDGHSSRPFDCESCGDNPTCAGEMVQRICKRCGLKEWVYSVSVGDQHL